jgi:hypothetical protein
MTARTSIASTLGTFATLLFLQGCQEQARCAASGGDWDTCASVDLRCVEGELIPITGDEPAICEHGCHCPDEAPVWDAGAGCLTEAECVEGA